MDDPAPERTGTDVKIHEVHAKWSAISKIIFGFSKWGSLAFISWRTQIAVVALAGKNTLANIDLSARLQAGQSHSTTTLSGGDTWLVLALVLSLLVAVAAIAYGRAQAKLRRDTVESMHKYQVLYEKGIDPNRSSSELTPRGETRPDDHDG